MLAAHQRGKELNEMKVEQTLQGADSLLTGGPWGCRIQGQHQLVGHKGKDDPEEPECISLAEATVTNGCNLPLKG